MRKDFGNNGGRYDRIIIYNAKWKNCINSQRKVKVMLLVRGSSLILPRGDTGYIRVLKSQDDKFSAGDKVRFVVRDKSSVLINIEITEFDENGTALIYLSKEITNKLTVGLYYYDLRIIYENGEIDTEIRKGILQVIDVAVSESEVSQ